MIEGIKIEIEENIPAKAANGRKLPSTREYSIGTELYDNLGVGSSSFFSNDLNLKPKSILIRLARINEQNIKLQNKISGTKLTLEDGRKFSYNLDIKEVLVNDKIENIEGFRVHRIK